MANKNGQGYKNEVFDLQNMLYTISRAEKGVPDVIPDGVFGHRTSQAISKFQQSVGISPSGIADSETWKVLSEKHRSVLRKKAPATKVKMFTKDVAKNGYDDCVYLVQILFNKLSKQYKGFESGKISGTLDDITQRNLRQFQSISNLDPHGELDRDTWEMIAVYYNNF